MCIVRNRKLPHGETVAALDGSSANKSLMGMRLYEWSLFIHCNAESATGGASTLLGSSGFGTYGVTAVLT